jgi:ketosteroid isomerase-like protein
MQILVTMLLMLCAASAHWSSRGETQPRSNAITHSEILEAERSLATAVAQRDTVALESILADDVRIVAADGRLLDEAHLLSSVRAGSPANAVTPLEPDVRLYETMAIVHGQAVVDDTSKGPAGAARPKKQLYVLHIWASPGDGWELVADHTTDITEHATAEPPAFATLDAPVPAGPAHRAPSHATGDADGTAADVKEALRTSHHRYWAKDVAGYQRTIGSDLIRAAETGVRPGSDLVTFMKSNPRLPQPPPDQLEMWAKVFGNVAVGGWLDRGKNRDGGVSRNRFTLALVWRDGRWQIVQIQSTGVAARSK